MVNASKEKRIVTGNQIEKIGAAWNHRKRTFEVHCEGTPVYLTPHEIIELGVELVIEGTKAMTERRWH